MQVKLLSSVSILTDFPGTLKREEPGQVKLLEEAKTKKKLVWSVKEDNQWTVSPNPLLANSLKHPAETYTTKAKPNKKLYSVKQWLIYIRFSKTTVLEMNQFKLANTKIDCNVTIIDIQCLESYVLWHVELSIVKDNCTIYDEQSPFICQLNKELSYFLITTKAVMFKFMEFFN